MQYKDETNVDVLEEVHIACKMMVRVEKLTDTLHHYRN